MKTDDLIELLATGVVPVDRNASRHRLGIGLSLAGLGSLLMMMWKFGVRPDIASVIPTPLFWATLAFPLCMAAGALLVTARLARPGAGVGLGWPALAAPVAAVWLAGIGVVATAAPADRLPLILGSSWQVCPFHILLLALPAFVAIFWAVKGLAPTRLRFAGAAAGLLAGAVGTLAYCFRCPESSVAFWGIWYLLGMILSSLAGAVLGPALLRW
jgi:hypothetical protein